jgi:hypothetical protein
MEVPYQLYKTQSIQIQKIVYFKITMQNMKGELYTCQSTQFIQTLPTVFLKITAQKVQVQYLL